MHLRAMVDQIRKCGRLLVLPASLLLAASGALGADSVVDESFVARTAERVIKHSLVLGEPVGRIWDLYTSAVGLESWAAPNVEVDLRIGGTISSNFKVGASVGAPGTVVTEILHIIPEEEIVLRDDLVSLLTMGGLYEWLDIFPQAFLAELETGGDDVFTTVRFERVAAHQTRLTVLSYSYGQGAEWDRVYEEA